MTFSKFDEHSSPLFKNLNIIKLHDLVLYQNAIFRYRFKNTLLPLVFNNFFIEVSEVHQYNTRSAAKQSFHLPKVRTNYGKFNKSKLAFFQNLNSKGTISFIILMTLS